MPSDDVVDFSEEFKDFVARIKGRKFQAQTGLIYLFQLLREIINFNLFLCFYRDLVLFMIP